MRLARKLTAALVLGITLVMAGNAMLQVRREGTLFDLDSRRDQHAVGRVLHAAVETVWPAEGEAAARRLIAQVSRESTTLTMRWVSLRPDAPESDVPLVEPGRLGPVREGRVIVLRATSFRRGRAPRNLHAAHVPG